MTIGFIFKKVGGAQIFLIRYNSRVKVSYISNKTKTFYGGWLFQSMFPVYKF